MIKIKELESTVIFSKDFIKQKRVKKDKLLLIASYLKLNSPLNGNVGISINLLAEKIGYKPDAHENKINDNIKSTLSSLINTEDILIESKLFWDKKNKWTYRDIDLKELKATECILIHINEESKLYNPNDQYVVLTDSEFTTITQSSVSADREDILNTYLNIKKFMSFGKDVQQLCYPSHTTLVKDCHISSKGAINNIINDLKTMGLLYTYNSGRFIDGNGKVRFANNFYTLEKDLLKADICDELIRQYYSTRGVIINEFIKDDTKV